jgi:hypothetical protein
VKRAVCIALVLAAASVLGAAARRDNHLSSYRIRFAAVVGNERFACGTIYHGVGLTRSAITSEFLRLYVFEFAVIDANGKIVPLLLDQDGICQQHDVAFLSFEGSHGSCASGSPKEHEFVTGSVPKAKYMGIRLAVGVPQSLDHADATIVSSPVNLSDMFWSWQDG